MNKFIGLTKVEFKKQFKKISIKIILLLILISSLLVPFVKKVIDDKFSAQDYSSMYQNNINYINMDLSSMEKSDSQRDKLRKKYLEAEKEMYESLIKANVGYDSWIYTNSYELYIKKQEEIALQALIDNYDKGIVEESLYGDALEGIKEYFEAPKEEIEKELSEIRQSQNVLAESVKNNDYLKYVAGIVDIQEKSIDNAKKDISKLENNIEENRKNNNDKEVENLQNILDDAKISLNKTEELLKVNKYRYDNKIAYDKNNWKSETLKNIEFLINSRQEKVLSEEQFKQQLMWEISNGLTYDIYKENIKEKLEKTNQDIEVNWYSINNNIPQMEFNNDARTSVNKIYMTYISVVVVLGIIIAGGIVSSEFSKGTIRLLMIRPVSRWKILLSKLTTVLLICYGILILSVIGLVLSSGLTYGFEGFGYDVLTYSNGTIIQQGFIGTIIPKLLFASISLIFIVALAFTLSTVAKNTALSVALPIIIYMASLPATMVMLELKMKWVAKTFIPYINLTTYETNSFYVEMFKQQYGLNMNPNLGASQLIVLSALFLLVAFIVFKKRDVVN